MNGWIGSRSPHQKNLAKTAILLSGATCGESFGVGTRSSTLEGMWYVVWIFSKILCVRRLCKWFKLESESKCTPTRSSGMDRSVRLGEDPSVHSGGAPCSYSDRELRLMHLFRLFFKEELFCLCLKLVGLSLETALFLFFKDDFG